MMEEKSFGVIPVKIVNHSPTVLLVRLQAGHWGFPKGHPEKAESPLETAARELQEETGLSISSWIDATAIQEAYWYTRNHKKCFKTVDYFLAFVEGNVSLQQEEIAEARWISPKEAVSLLTFKEAKATARQVLLRLSSL